MSLAVVSSTVQASWYQIEVIVFENKNPDTDGESWYESPDSSEREEVIELISDIADVDITKSEKVEDAAITEGELIPFLAFEKENFRLNDIFRILKISSNYNPVFHTAWQQPGLETDYAKYIHLDDVDKEQFIEYDMLPELAELEFSEELFIPERGTFNGTIRLRSTKYLHVDVEMNYFPEFTKQKKDIASQEEDTLKSYMQYVDTVRLKESRKIKLNDLHYFDHPYFGVLVQVSRIKLKE